MKRLLGLLLVLVMVGCGKSDEPPAQAGYAGLAEGVKKAAVFFAPNNIGELESLGLGTRATDAMLVHLKGLTKLQELWLNDAKITDAGLVHLKGLTNLERLHLERTQITDTGLVQLSGMNLERLRIPLRAQTNTGLKHHLAAVKPPTLLLLSSYKLTDSGLVHLKGLTSLRQLHLPEQITDAGLVHLKGLTELEELNLARTEITDAGLVHLTGLSSLRTLMLDSTRITNAGIAQLKKALPNCKISK